MDKLAGFAGSLGVGGFPHGDDDDLRGAAEKASYHAGESGGVDLFSSILSAVGNKKEHLANENVDEEDTINQHKRFYENEADEKDADDKSLGSAAALQALKMFASGQSGSSHGGSSQSEFVALAMAEASKLVDQNASKGKISSEKKESAVQQAAEMALKMYLQSGKGSNEQESSSASGLINLASKYLR